MSGQLKKAILPLHSVKGRSSIQAHVRLRGAQGRDFMWTCLFVPQRRLFGTGKGTLEWFYIHAFPHWIAFPTPIIRRFFSVTEKVSVCPRRLSASRWFSACTSAKTGDIKSKEPNNKVWPKTLKKGGSYWSLMGQFIASRGFVLLQLLIFLSLELSS